MNKIKNSIKKSGFTLVELLAVIVILAVILVIAVPKVMNIINDTKKSTFSNSVKLIASSAEQRYAENKAVGNTDKITCKDVAKLSSEDYKLCEITFEKEKARVTVIGDGKFDGLSVVYASKTNAEVQTGEPERLYTFDEVYSLIDSMNNEMKVYKETIEELRNELKSDIKNNSDKIDSLGDGVNSEEIENLQNQINQSNDKINSNTTEISNVLTKVNKNTTDISSVLSKANSNATSISNLTNKDSSSNVFLKNYPVGSIYVSTSSANPGTKFGGTWVAFGSGRTLVGVDSTQEEFATVGLTGGEKEHTLIGDELPNLYYRIHTESGSPDLTYWNTTASRGNQIAGLGYGLGDDFLNIGPLGKGLAHNNLQPYITVYMWKRTA